MITFCFCILSAFLSLTIVTAYHETTALDTLYHAYGAYCGESDLKAWDCKWCNYHPNFEIILSSNDVVNADSLQAYIGYDSDKSQAVMSFRRTSMDKETLYDLGNNSFTLHSPI